MTDKKQTKTNHSQGQSGGDAILFNNVGHREIVQSSSPPADTHNKTREQELKESINKFQLSILNDIAKCSYLDGRKEGIKEERERILKIIDEVLKQKSEGDEK